MKSHSLIHNNIVCYFNSILQVISISISTPYQWKLISFIYLEYLLVYDEQCNLFILLLLIWIESLNTSKAKLDLFVH